MFHFFIERYCAAHLAEVADFIARVENKQPVAVIFEDGRRAMRLADAANESRASGRVVTVAVA